MKTSCVYAKPKKLTEEKTKQNPSSNIFSALIPPLNKLQKKRENKLVKDCNQLFINKMINFFSLARGTIQVHEIKQHREENKQKIGNEIYQQTCITQE